MRAAAFLLTLCLAGYVSTDYAWKVGYTYTYDVRGRVLTGLSQHTQYSGLQVEYQMELTVVGPDTIHLKPQNFRAVEVNSELDGGWRDGILQNENPVAIKGQLQKYLESPIEMRMKQGVVDSIKVDGRLPTWAVNMKKAQVSHFILDTTGVNVVVPGNMNRKTNAVRPDEQNQESGFFYETMEQTVHGECETYYTVSQNGPFDAPFQFQKQAQPVQRDDSTSSSEEKDAKSEQQNSSSQESSEENETNRHKYYDNFQQYATYKKLAQNQDSSSAEDSHETIQGELPWPKAFRKFCNQGDQIYEIVKSVNFTTCRNKPVLAYSTSAGLFDRFGDNSIGSLWERTVNTRFLACGRDRKQYTILNVVQDEQTNSGHRLEQKILANSVQNLTLQQINKANGQIEQVEQPKEIHDLTYTFDPKEQKLQRQGQLQHAFAAADIFEENNDSNSSEEQQQGQQQQQQQQQYQRRYTYSQEKYNKQTSRQRQSGESSSQENDSQEQQGQYQSSGRRQQQQQYERRHGKSRRPRAVSQSQESSSSSSEESQERRYQSNEKYHTDAENRKFLPMPSLTNPPLSQMLISGLQTEGMRSRIQNLMKEIVQDIQDTKQSLAETETISKITTVARVLRRLPYSENERLYREIASKDQTEEQQIARNVFLDALVMSGNNPSIKLVFDLIKKKEIQGEEAAQLLMALPLNIRTPTQQLAKEFFDLVDSDALHVEHAQQARTTAILAFSKFLHQAYVNTRIRNTRYPVQIYGQFGDAKFVQRNFVQHFVQQVEKHFDQQQGDPAPEQKHWIVVYLNALGNLGVPEVVPVVQRILDDSTDPYIKTQAIFALKGLLQSRQQENIPAEGIQAVDRDSQDFLTDKFIEQQVLPLLAAAAFDRGEYPSVRMAAISLLLYTTDADITIWQQLAYSTWFAASQEVHAFVYTSLHKLAHIEGPLNGLLWPMVRKARTVLSLAKPIVPGYAKSRNSFVSAFAEHLQTSIAHQFQYFGAKDSNIPQYMYYRNFVSQGQGAYGFSPLEISAHGHTIQKLVDFFIDEVQEKKPQLQEAHPDFLQLGQILGIQKRKQEEEIEGAVQFTIRNEMQRIFSVNEQKIKELIKRTQTNLFPQLLNGIPFNYQKTFQFAEHNAEFPSGLGIPISFTYRLPVHLSLRGTIKVVQENGARDSQVVAEVHAVYGWKSHARLAYKAPFVGKQYQSGIQRHIVVEAPLRAAVRLAPQGQLVIAITPAQLEKGNPSGEIDLVTYHQHPYTIIISDNLWPVSHKEGGKMELIRTNPTETQQTPYKNQQTFGEELFGLSFRLDEESDYRDESEGISQWARLWKSFHSPGCLFNLGWMGSKDIRFVERKLTLDIQKSQTKTLALIVGGKIHKQAQYKSLWEDSSSQSSQSSEESASSESSADSSSQQQGSTEEQIRQQKQQQKLARQQKRQQQRRDNTDSSSSSSSSSASVEDQQQSGVVYAVALIGKRVPLRSPQEFRSVQKLLDQPQYPTTVQYLLQVSQSAGRMYIRGASGDAANEAAQALPKSSESLQALRQAVKDAPNAQSQPDGCFEFEGEYERPQSYEREQLLVLRKKLLQDELQVQVKGELQYGRSCKGMPHEIKVQGKLHRNKEMTEYAQTKSRKAQKCQEDEKKGFSVSPVCVEVAEQQAAALNEGQFKIRFTELPEEFRNASYQFEDVVKSLFYPYMSHDRTHPGAGEGQAQIQFQITPDRQFASLEIIKSNSRLTFEDVKTNRVFRAVLPLTATQSVQQNVADRLFRSESQPSCQLEGNYINTFDNVTYRFSSQAAEGCVHVLAQDCSEQYPVAVLAKDIAADQSEVTILLGQKTKVQLTPQGKQRLGKSKVQVRINGQRIESLPTQIRDQDSKQTVVYVEQMYDGGVQVFSEHFDVASNGQYIVVYASNALRNKTCGLCGDFNGEKVGEMKSPKNCALSSGSALVASYAYQSQDKNDRSKCKVDRQIQKQVQQEERQCLTDETYFANNPRRYSQPGQAQSQYEQYYQNRRQNQNQQYQGKNGQYPFSYYPSAAQHQRSSTEQKNYVQSDECASELAPAIQQALRQALKPVLKARIWNQEKRQKYTEKIIRKVMEKEQQWSQQGTPDKIAHAVANQVCDAFQASSLSSNVVSYLCKISKQYLINALKLELNPVCEKSDCCEKEHQSSNERQQLRAEMSYIMADSAESEETDIPYINQGSRSKVGCQKMIQEHLEASIPKQVYMYLQGDDDSKMSQTEIRSLVDDYKVRIPKAVQKTFQRASQATTKFADNLIEAVDQAFEKLPQGQEVAHKLHQLVRDYVDVAVKQLNRVTKGKCNYNKYN